MEWPLLGQLCQARHDDGLDLGGDLRGSLPQGLGWLLNGGDQDRDGALVLKWQAASQGLVEHHPQGIDVAGWRDHSVAGRLLRSYVGGCSENGPSGSEAQVGFHLTGYPEVGDQWAAILVIDQNVVWLEVAMDDPMVVGIGHAPRNSQPDLDDLTQRRLLP